MSSSISPSDPLAQFASILSELSPEERKSIQHGKSWTVIDATIIVLNSSLDVETSIALIQKCNSLKEFIKKDIELDPETIYQKFSAKTSSGTAEKTHHVALEEGGFRGYLSSWIPDVVMRYLANAAFAVNRWRGVSPELLSIDPKKLGLNKASAESISQSVRLLLKYTCQQLLLFEKHPTSEPPSFIKPFFIQKDSPKEGNPYALNNFGSILKYRLITQVDGSFFIKEEELESLVDSTRAILFAILRNFAQASEKGISFPPELLKKMQETPEKLVESSPEITNFFLSLVLPNGPNDIAIPFFSNFVYSQIKSIFNKKMPLLLETIRRKKPTSESTSIAQVKGKKLPEQIPEDPSLSTIFSKKEQEELASLMEGIPYFSKRLAQTQPKAESPSLIEALGEVASTAIRGLLPKSDQEMIPPRIPQSDTEKSFQKTLFEASKKTFSFLEKLLDPSQCTTTSAPPKFLEKLFTLENNQYKLLAQGILLKSMLKEKDLIETASRVSSSFLFGACSQLKEKIKEGKIQIPQELLSSTASNREKKITAFLISLVAEKKDLSLPPHS